MPKTVIPLTATQVKNARSANKVYKRADGGGLYLRVLPSGKKTWELHVTVIGHIPVAQLHPVDIVESLKSMESCGLLEYLKRTKSGVRLALDFAVSRGLIDFNPAAAVTVQVFRKHSSRPMRALAPKQLPALIGAIAYPINFDYTFWMRYSVDFRRKVLSVREKEGLTIAQVAARFNIGVASVVRWLKQLEPKVHGFRRRKIDRDAFQSGRAARFGVHQNAICHALKSLCHPKTCAVARRIFQTIIGHHKLEGRPMVSIDESGFAHDMPRTHGYAPVGERGHGTQDRHARGRTNAIVWGGALFVQGGTAKILV